MQRSFSDGELIPTAYTQVDEAQRRRGRELEDRLDRILGRHRAAGKSSTPPRTTSPHASSNASRSVNNISVGNSVNQPPASAKAESKLWQLPSQEEVPGASPEAEEADTPQKRSVTPRGNGAEAAAQETVVAGTPSDAHAEKSGLDASPSSNQDDNGIYGTVKSLKNQREIDFTVKFVEKRRRKASTKSS